MGHGSFEGIKENSKVNKVGAAEEDQHCRPQQQKNVEVSTSLNNLDAPGGMSFDPHAMSVGSKGQERGLAYLRGWESLRIWE